MKSTFFPEIKSIINIPAWAQERDADSKVKTSAEAYTLVPLIHRCVNMRASMLSGIPIRTYKNKEKAPWFFDDIPAREMIFRTEAALLLTGAAYWLKATNAAGVTTGIRWLNNGTRSPVSCHSIRPLAVRSMVLGLKSRCSTSGTSTRLMMLVEACPA